MDKQMPGSNTLRQVDAAIASRVLVQFILTHGSWSLLSTICFGGCGWVSKARAQATSALSGRDLFT